ncbi:anti-sigma-I factor RsgI family protein [Proteiniclasticum ruminis]|uniref:anti-sigma-I factor RsgI family protein n=1 Tax=Proteiniclasticum ruminis TaxID=398199 RepID=UPI0028974400|nr:hypothetical protein [Proteiniclasticum ruminis]
MFEGIVLKVTSEYSIVKTKSEYLKVHTKTLMEPGQRIYFTKEDIIQTPTIKKKPAPYFLRYGAAAALAVLLLSSPLLEKKSVYAAKLLVEVNPSILLDISQDGLVDEALPYNEEASLLPLDRYKDLPVEEAIEEILRDAVKEGLLNLEDEEEDFIILTEILTSGDRLSEEIFAKLEEQSLAGDFLSETSVIFTSTSEEHLSEMKNQGKALGLMRLREEFNLGPDEKLGDFFKDPERREAYKEQKRLLKRSTLEEEEDLVEDFPEEITDAFKEQLALFKSSIEEVKEARKAYQEARKTGDEKAIEETLQALKEAVEKKEQMEDLKDQLEQAKLEKENTEASGETPDNNGTTPAKPGNNGNTSGNKDAVPGKPETPGNSGNSTGETETPGTQKNPETPSNSGTKPEENPNSTENQGKPSENKKPETPGTLPSDNNGKNPAKDAPGKNK